MEMIKVWIGTADGGGNEYDATNCCGWTLEEQAPVEVPKHLHEALLAAQAAAYAAKLALDVWVKDNIK